MSKNENLDKDIDLKQYRDQNGVSLREMNFGLWLAEHHRQLIKIVIVFLVAISAFFFIYSSYNYIIYFLSGDSNNQIVNDNLLSSPRKITSDLEIAPLRIFKSNARYDLAVKITNPNDKFMATFNYCFRQADKDIICGDGFILPSEEKYILGLGQDLVGSQNEAAFTITDIFWRRIDSRRIPMWDDFAESRLNFAVFNLNFSSTESSGLSEKIGLNTLEFTIKNQTAYSYYEAPLNITLFSGSELVGVNRYLLNNFLAGDERQIRISWPGNLRAVNRTEVKPDINIMDDGAYLKYQGENPK